jgi:hypothetical protein
LNRRQLKKSCQFLKFGSDVPNSNRAMVRRAVPIPFLDEFARSERETIMAIGVSDLENLPRNRLAFRYEEFVTLR